MLNHIYRWHQAITQKFAITFGLSDDLSHHNRLNNPPHLHDGYKKHNKRAADFHKNHASKIERGENGNGLVAKWERFFYRKGKAFIKTVK